MMVTTGPPHPHPPSPSFRHLGRMSDERGTFEHADHADPRRVHGYCTDDMARVLVVTSREPDPDPLVVGLARTALRFLAEAQDGVGASRNRMDVRGRWLDGHGTDDCWGRSLWAFGTAAARNPDHEVRKAALAHFERGTEQRSPWPRAMAFAALGAAEVAAARPGHIRARGLLAAAAEVIGACGSDPSWPWPEPRLTYANAVLPDAMIAIGAALGRERVRDDGLTLLTWLLDHETADGHLSVTPVGGLGSGDPRPAFDQQPIEVAALADACVRASRLTRSDMWPTDDPLELIDPRTFLAGVDRAVAWFLGDNDGHAVMWDAETGGGYDGLRADGPNLNQGTESTLALISTLQHARDLAPVAP